MSDEAIERFFGEYAERYMTFDAEAIAAVYEVPFLAVREGRPIHLGDHAAVLEHLTVLMDAYREAGAARATIADLHVHRLDATSVVATVRWNALSDNGAILRDFTTSYHLLRQERGDWRVLSYTYHHG